MKIDSTHPLPAQPLPDSNGTFKTLDIGGFSRHLHAWLFSIPNLQLNELSTSMINLVPETVGFPVTENKFILHFCCILIIVTLEHVVYKWLPVLLVSKITTA